MKDVLKCGDGERLKISTLIVLLGLQKGGVSLVNIAFGSGELNIWGKQFVEYQGSR